MNNSLISRTGDIAILPVTKSIIDVFTGTGWDNWSRFRLVKGFPKLIAGEAVTDREYKELLQRARK